MMQPVSGSRSSSTGAEIGFWATPDLRLGGGYNFSSSFDSPGSQPFNNSRRGFYFTISSKLSNLFDLFGTSNDGLQAPADAKPIDAGGGERP
jgi:hypothetical protein